MAPRATFLMNCWYVAAWDHELIDGKLLARTILEQPLLLYKGDSGKVVALDNRCCHRGAKLSNGRLEGDCVRCMYHGLKFDATGKCVQIPGQDNIPAKLGVRSYPIVEHDHLIWVWMGDASKADASLIVDLPYLHDAGWRGKPGYMHYAADYRLIVDNLSDFAHLAFVHARTLGGSEEYAFQSKPLAIERLDNGFRVERWHMNTTPPPFHLKVTRDTAAVDRRNIGLMHVPGIFMMETLFAPAGTGAEKGNRDHAKEYRNCQFFTPETRRSTRRRGGLGGCCDGWRGRGWQRERNWRRWWYFGRRPRCTEQRGSATSDLGDRDALRRLRRQSRRDGPVACTRFANTD